MLSLNGNLIYLDAVKFKIENDEVNIYYHFSDKSHTLLYKCQINIAYL